MIKRPTILCDQGHILFHFKGMFIIWLCTMFMCVSRQVSIDTHINICRGHWASLCPSLTTKPFEAGSLPKAGTHVSLVRLEASEPQRSSWLLSLPPLQCAGHLACDRSVRTQTPALRTTQQVLLALSHLASPIFFFFKGKGCLFLLLRKP